MNVSLPTLFQADLLLCWFCTSHQEQKDTRYKVSLLPKEPQVKQHNAENSAYYAEKYQWLNSFLIHLSALTHLKITVILKIVQIHQ